MDNSNLDKKIDKLINAIEFLVDAVERGKGDNGYMSNSRFVRRIKDGGNDYLYKEFEELGQDDIEKIRDEIISNYQKGIKKANRKFNQLRKDLDKASTQSEKDEIRRKINENERKKNELKRNKKKISNTDIEDYYNNYVREDSDYQLSKRWKELGKNEKKHYKDEQDFKNSEREKFKYHQTSNERDEVRRRIANSGLGTVGRYGQKMFDMQQRAADLGNFANYLNHGGASKIGGMFGGGKATANVIAGLGKFSKGLGFASKLMGGPYVQAILMAIDALHKIGDMMGSWKQYTAQMIKFQTQEEQLQYENTKRTAELANESDIEDVKYVGEMQMKMMEVQGQNLLDAVSLNNQQYINAIQAAVGPMMQGINASAYQAAENSISAASEYEKLQLQKGLRERKQGRYEDARTTEYEGAKKVLTAQKNVADIDYITGENTIQWEREAYRMRNPLQSAVRDNNAWQTEVNVERNGNGRTIGGTVRSDSDVGAVNPYTGERYRNQGRYNNNGIGSDAGNAANYYLLGENYVNGVIEKSSAMIAQQNQSMKQYAESSLDLVQQQYNLLNTQKQVGNEIRDLQEETAVNVQEKFIDSAETVKKTYLKLAQQEEQFLDNVDKLTNNSATSMGFTNPIQMKQFQTYLITQAKDVATQFGKSIEEVVVTQNQYIESTGRNKMLGSHDYGQLFGLGRYLGDDNLAAQYGAEMEIFNHGIEDSVDMLDDVLKDVNKIGLNGRKYTKDLVNNLKLAHKYNFKGGTKELMEMAKWAQNTRFNLSSLSSMIDKVQEGGIEGVITQSAGFQVLGGHAAINSDPLGMLYDAWGDPQAYAKRMQDMTKGFGRFDAKTGETKFNINESMQIAQMAKLQGRSAEELRDEIIQRNKRGQIDTKLDSYQNFDEDQKALISNKAEYKNGQWQVRMNNGDTKNVSQLSKGDLDNLMPTDHNERMEDYMKKIVTGVEKLTGEENREKLDQGLLNITNYWNEYSERLKSAQDSYEKNRETFAAEIKKNMSLATDSFGDYLSRINESNSGINDAMSKIDVHVGHLETALSSLVKIITTANDKLGFNDKGQTVDSPRTNPAAVRQPGVNRNDNSVITSYGFDASSAGNMFNTDWKMSIYNGQDDYHFGGSAPWNPPISYPVTHDAVTSGDGKPMLVSAKQVTSVHDGTAKVAKTDPNDTALFAKSGGPFDKLFDGIFGRVNTIYNEVVNNRYGGASGSSLVSNRFGGDVRSASTNSVSNVYDSNSLVSNRFGGDVRSASTNSVSNVYDGNSLVSNRFGGDVRSASTNSVSNVYDSNSLVSNRFGGDVRGASTNSVSNVYDGNSLVSNRFGGDVRGASTNSVSNVYDSNSLVSNRFGGDVRGASTNSVSNVYDSNSLVSNRFGGDVRGGNAAINSDPLGMLYDALIDPQSYAKRMQDMTKGLGRFDAKTGERKFNINESMQIAHLAKLQGRSAEELRDEIIQRNERSQIDNKDVRSASTNSVSNVYDGSSLVSNRFGGDAVRSAYTNSVSNVYDGSSLVSNRFGGDAIASPTEVQLTINGKIELTGQNGQSIDIMDTLRNNPMFVRQITEMIVLQMNNNTHGGRNELFHNRFSG
jgi:hypothetical protein